MGENLYHIYFRQGANNQNLQRTVEIKYQENKTANKQTD